MSRLPQVTARQMLAALQRAGFTTKRIKGSHHYLVHASDPSRRTTVAVHSGDLPPRNVQDMLKQAKLSRDEATRKPGFQRFPVGNYLIHHDKSHGGRHVT